MNYWNRIRSVVRSAQAATASEPKNLASLAPLLDDALSLLLKSPSKESISEIDYLLTRAQEFLVRWRPSPQPSPGVFYVQPLWARSTDEQISEALSLLKKIDLSTSTNSERVTTMKIFISHSNADKKIAESLIDLIRLALNVKAGDIRCTSVDGYKLPAGAESNNQLKTEVFESEIFIAILSPTSMTSIYVMFELGARWGANRYLAPIMTNGTKARDLKAPLSAIHAITGSSEPDMLQLIEDLAERLHITTEKPAIYNKALRAFTECASAPKLA